VQTLVPLLLLPRLAKGKMFCIPNFGETTLVHETKSLLSTGGLFFLLQIGYLVGWGSDSLIISSALGAAEVTTLSIVQRLFQFVFVPLSIINAPMWGAYADASARGDGDFISRALRSAILRTVLLAIVGCLGLILSSPIIFNFWLPGDAKIPHSLVATYGLWIFVQCAFMPVSILFNGLGVIRAQVFVVIAFCVVCLPLKFYLIQHAGVVGVVQAAVIAYILTAAIPYLIVLSREPLRGHLVR
jgi:O-antigen/teichoic acid export membrane protein